MKRLITALLSLAFAATAAATGPDRSRPPATGEVRPFTVKEPVRFTGPGGMPVLLIERHEVPLVNVVLQVRAGAEADPEKLPGLADWTAAMLMEGAGSHGSLELSDEVDFLGASLSTSGGWQASGATLQVPAARLDPALALLADVVARPTFPKEEWERFKKKRMTRFLQERDQPYALASAANARALYGDGHRYGLPRSGTSKALAAAKLDDLKRFWAEQWAPDNAFLVVVGDVTKDDLEAKLKTHLSSWKRGARKPAPFSLKAPAKLLGRQVILIDKPGAPQSVVSALARAPDGLEEMSADNDVMNTLLGGSFTSRLNQNLREENGYSYGARSNFDLRRLGNGFSAMSAVATPVTAPAVHEILSEISRIRSYVEDSEAERARRYTALTFPSMFESGRQVAGFWAWAEAKGVSPRTIKSYAARVLEVDERAMLLAALRDVDAKNMRVVVVGDRATVEKDLSSFGPVTIWSVDDLLGPPPAP
jgi:zinc protease